MGMKKTNEPFERKFYRNTVTPRYSPQQIFILCLDFKIQDNANMLVAL